MFAPVYAITGPQSPDENITFAWTICNHPPIQPDMNWDEEIDAIGLLCPLPVLKLRKRLKSHGTGAVVRLLADDPAAVIDVAHFCNQAGHELLDSGETEDGQAYLVRKA